jgi:hypothetical protein
MNLVAVQSAELLDEEVGAVMSSLDKCIRQHVLTAEQKPLFLLSLKRGVPSIALTAMPSGKPRLNLTYPVLAQYMP